VRGFHAKLREAHAYSADRILISLCFREKIARHEKCDDMLQYSRKGKIMKKHLAQILLLLAVGSARGQGTLQVDQQVAATDSAAGNILISSVQGLQPMGQSFVPSLSSIGFIRLFLFDAVSPDPAGATVVINLWSGSIGGGNLMASTDSIILPPGFNSIANFYFATPVALTSGTTYYFQPSVQSGDTLDAGIVSGLSGYANGTAIYNGTPSATQDLWFREGIVVPEPSSTLLALAGFVGFYFCRKRIFLRR
jgi:hypothetical protein